MTKSMIAKNTKRIIAQKGLKNYAVAEKAGFSEKQFSALLNGRRIIKAIDVIAIANVLNVTPNDLFGITSVDNMQA